MNRECLTLPATEREKWPFPRVWARWMHILMVDGGERERRRMKEYMMYADTW